MNRIIDILDDAVEGEFARYHEDRCRNIAVRFPDNTINMHRCWVNPVEHTLFIEGEGYGGAQVENWFLDCARDNLGLLFEDGTEVSFKRAGKSLEEFQHEVAEFIEKYRKNGYDMEREYRIEDEMDML
jgi:hypothetical protein